MSQSRSAIERGNPPPRRKSCAACIKAKRRCDLRQPSCLRCSQRKIGCSYPSHAENQPSSRSSDTSSCQDGMGISPSLLQSQELAKGLFPEMETSWETSGFDFNMDMNPQPSCLIFPTMPFDEPPLQGLEFLDEIVSMENTLSAIPVPSTPGRTSAAPVEDPMSVVLRSPRPEMASMSRIQLLRVASELIEKRLRYTIDAFKRTPETMVLEGGTPWSHPALYQDSMPAFLEANKKAYLDALAACALHRAKNTVNTHMIQRVIEVRYERLLTAPIPTSSSRDMLARTHALLLYQIMLSFDDSSIARALAEETISALSDSAMALLQFVHHEDESEDDIDNDNNSSRHIPLYPSTAARALYNDWTFQESVRRTSLVSFFFIQLQSIIRADLSILMCVPSSPQPTSCVSPDVSIIAAVNQTLREGPYNDTTRCDTRLLLCRSLTMSAHLWHARDAVAFAVAWREKKHFVARPWNIWNRLETAQPDDIDELGRMLMTSGLGIEQVQGWFAAKGGSL